VANNKLQVASGKRQLTNWGTMTAVCGKERGFEFKKKKNKIKYT